LLKTLVIPTKAILEALLILIKAVLEILPKALLTEAALNVTRGSRDAEILTKALLRILTKP
jgi:hypothetical protein